MRRDFGNLCCIYADVLKLLNDQSYNSIGMCATRILTLFIGTKTQNGNSLKYLEGLKPQTGRLATYVELCTYDFTATHQTRENTSECQCRPYITFSDGL